MNKSSTLFLIAFLVFFLIIIPYLSLAESKDFSPEEPEDWPKIFSGVKNASEKTKQIRNEIEVRPALILGILNQESSYGKNIGKTKNGWKNYCEVEENKNETSCKYWNAYDCKSDYSNVGKTIKEGGKEKKINYFEEICNALGFKIEIVQTSFTCALGFTQFEPATWWDIKERHKEDALTNPWSYHDSILACGYKLKEDGASENEIIALTKYYGSADFKKYINPIFATAKLWEDNFLKPAATTFCKTPTDFLCALEKLKEISKKCCKTKESCNLYKIKEELKEQIKKEEEKRASEVQLESFEKSSPEKIVKEREKLQPEKSLLEKIKDIPQNISEGISNFFEEKVDNIISGEIFTNIKNRISQLNLFKKEIPIGIYVNIDDEKDFVELKEDRTFYSEQAFDFAMKGYGMEYKTGFTLASSGKYVIQGSKITFKIKRLISGGFEMELPGIFSTKCRLVENGFDCEDGTQYRKIKKKETKETTELLEETGPAALVPPSTGEEKPKEKKTEPEKKVPEPEKETINYIKQRILESGDNKIHGFTYYNGYLWASTRTSSGRILKINPQTLDYEKITLDYGLDDGEDLIAAEGYIWVMLYTFPSRIIRVNPTTLDWEVAITFELDEIRYGGSLEYAFGYLWAGGYGKIAKINIKTLKYEIYDYSNIVGDNQFHALTNGGGYIWASSPQYTGGWFGRFYEGNIILRINPNNPTIYEGLKLTRQISDDITYINDALYVCSETVPSYFYKINDNLSYSSIEVTDTICYGMFKDERNNLWGAYVGRPGKLFTSDLNLKSKKMYSLPSGFNDANEITFDELGNMYTTCWESPAKIVKIKI